MDMIPYQCKNIIQNITFSNDNIVVYNFNKLLDSLNINSNQLIDLCICCGTDFNNKLINIKCKDIYKLIKRYGSIEEIIDKLDIINSDRDKIIKIPYQFDYKISRNIFKKLLDNIDRDYLIKVLEIMKKY